MAIKISGFNVINDSRALINITSFEGGLTLNGNFKQPVNVLSPLGDRSGAGANVRTIYCEFSNYYTAFIGASCVIEFFSPPQNVAYSFTLEVNYTSGTITWPTNVKWPGDSAPTLTASKTHMFIFVTDDGGTTWRGASILDYTQ
jgi:hypothetical protein